MALNEWGVESLPAEERMELMAALEPYVNKVSALDSAQEIRKFFVDEGIKACRNDGLSCAIAAYVRRGSGREVVVTYGGIRDLRMDKMFALTEAMDDFMIHFDGGFYPELEA